MQVRHGLPWLLALALVANCGRSKPASEQAAAPHGPTPPREWTIEPGQRVGLLEASGSEVDLAQSYGAANVGQATIDMGEGEMATGTVLFPPDSLRRIHIIWKDAEGKRLPDVAILRGHRSIWTLPSGVSLGTSLRELEEKNGRPFLLLGFGGNMEGFIKSWNRGKLDTALTARVKLYLAPDPAMQASPESSEVQGDREYLSNSPGMDRLNPTVYQIIADFHPPLTPADTAGARAYRIGEEDNGKEFSYAAASRFTVILDERKHSQNSLAPKPAGIIGRAQNIPSVEPPLYAASFEAVRPGRCVLTAKGFRVMIQVTDK